ncbi:unnamed protein product, partial [Ixodes hexagonus]
MSERAGQLENVLDRLSKKGFGLRMYALAAGEQAEYLHFDLEEKERMDRVRSVVTDASAALAKVEQRLKGLNLVLLFYASGLKFLYE